jgi:hypothetical protein
MFVLITILPMPVSFGSAAAAPTVGLGLVRFSHAHSRPGGLRAGACDSMQQQWRRG